MSGVGVVLQSESVTAEKFLQKSFKFRLQGLERFIAVGGQEPVVDEYLQRAAGQRKFPFQFGFGIEPLISVESGKRGLPEPVLVRPLNRRFAIVAESPTAAGMVESVIRLVADQKNAPWTPTARRAAFIIVNM